MRISWHQDTTNALTDVHPRLVSVVERAMEISVIEFRVHDGIRTLEEQKEYVRCGVAQTLTSLHLKQTDTGFAHAVDLAPFINGKVRFERIPLYHVAAAMHHASQELGVPLVWGGVWDRTLTQLPGNAADLEDEVIAYTARRRQAGKKVSIDAHHYQLDGRNRQSFVEFNMWR
jgi:peptidoglycan LD-endopeptidase CwlK